MGQHLAVLIGAVVALCSIALAWNYYEAHDGKNKSRLPKGM